MGLDTAQIIARDQTEIASKTKTLTDTIIPSKIKTVTVTPFGSNLFAILVTFDNAWLPTTNFAQKGKIGLKAVFAKKLAKGLIQKSKIGLLPSCEAYYWPTSFVKTEKPLVGLTPTVSLVRGKPAQVAKGREGLALRVTAKQKPTREKPLEGLRPVITAKQKPTRIKPLLGIKATIKYTKSGP